MGKKVIKLNEKDIEGLVERIIKEESINEDLPRRERERHKTQFARKSFEPYSRESEIMNIFGPYSEDVPPNVVSYMRKNPALIIKRLVNVYGRDKVLQYIGEE